MKPLDSNEDYNPTKELISAIKELNSTYIPLAKYGLRNSDDGIYRSTCIEYLGTLGKLDSSDLVTALSDEDESVLLAAIEASEEFNSIDVEHALARLAMNSNSDFLTSWSVATLAIKKSDCKPLSVRKISEKWASSEIVQTSTSFYFSFVNNNERMFFKFLNFLKSNDHLVRGMVINLSYFFVSSIWSRELEEHLILHEPNEDWTSIKESLLDLILQLKTT